MKNPIERSTPRREEVILYVLLTVIGALPMIGVLADHTRFGVEATIGLILLALGLAGLAVAGWRAERGRHHTV